MRTLVRVRLKSPKASNQDIENWLRECEFHPTTIFFTEEDKKQIIDNPVQITGESDLLIASEAGLKASRILCTIPHEDEERATAISTVKWSVYFRDPTGASIFGIVCIEDKYMTVRLRHKVSKNLEVATEELIKKIIEEENLFEELHDFTILVREPGSTIAILNEKLILQYNNIK